MLIELCCQDYESAVLADKYGFERIELNMGLELGGLTPCKFVTKKIKENCKVKVVSMIRLRCGDFIYSKSEQDFMYQQAEELLESGADGIAFGALNEDLSIDIETTRRFVELAHKYEAEFVFHRAFDCSIADSEIEKLIDLKVDRLLTSGRTKNAELGSKNLKTLNEKYGNKIQILAGSGINPSNLKKLADESGLSQFHGSFSKLIESKENNGVSYGSFMTADEEKLKIVSQIKNSY